MTAAVRRLAPMPSLGGSASLGEAAAAFLCRDLSPASRRAYGLTLDRLCGALDPERPLREVTAQAMSQALHEAYPEAAPASWNQRVATVRSFTAFGLRQGWLDLDPACGLERRKVPEDHGRALSRQDVERLSALRDASVRDRCLWRFLYESAARAQEVLRLNVEDLDVTARRGITIRKGGDTDVLHYATGTARLLPKVIDGRTSGPLFLAERPPVPSRSPALLDLDPSTGRARLSYRRAAEIFTAASGGATLHHLRHSALTHLAEDGVPTVLLMAKSRHSSLRTLQRYARPGVEAVARLTAEHDPARRR